MFLRYVLVSGFCLLVDFFVFLTMLKVGVAPAPAGAIGYLGGAASHYFLSIALVFQSPNRRFAPARFVEFSLYILTALLGTALTAGIISLVLTFAADLGPVIAKVIATIITFGTIYVIRARILMREAMANTQSTRR